MVGQRLHRFVKDTFVNHGLLQFTQNSANWKKCVPLLRNINRNVLCKVSPIIYHSYKSKH
jgi:hypothetical protein